MRTNGHGMWCVCGGGVSEREMSSHGEACKKLCLLESHFRGVKPSPEWSIKPPRSEYIFGREEVENPSACAKRDVTLYELQVQFVRAIHAAGGKTALSHHVWATLKRSRAAVGSSSALEGAEGMEGVVEGTDDVDGDGVADASRDASHSSLSSRSSVASSTVSS